MSKATFTSDSNAGRTVAQNFQPKSGIGRFDAAYSTGQKKLTITVKLNFDFLTMKEFDRDTGIAADKWGARPDGPAWRADEKQSYRDSFKTIIESSGGRQDKFVCAKAGWTEFEAVVDLVIDPNASRASSHYWVQVAKAPADEGFRAMVAHGPDWNGRFCNTDIEPEQAKRRDDALGLFAMGWLHKAIIETGCDFLPFDTSSKSLSAAAAQSLANFAAKAKRYVTQDSMDAGVQIWAYAKTAAKDHMVTASGRSKAVADRLKSLLSPFGAAVQVVSKFSAQPWIETPLKENLDRRTTLSAADKQSRSFQGGMLLVKSFLNNSTKLALTDVPSIPRNYVVVAHEFGHMLGLPDEYFGVQCDRMKNVIDLRRDLISSPTVQKTVDRLANQQEGFAKLIERSGVAAPVMGSTSTVTDSIMYAGNRILPAHYVTLWQALAKCTKPHLDFDDWDIRTDNPRNAIHTLEAL
ncbi:MAG: hypothetical protein ACREMQ_18070 [Longimicrobiales bacterium]